MMKSIGYATLIKYGDNADNKQYLHIKGGYVRSYDDRTTMYNDNLWQRPQYANKEEKYWKEWHDTHKGIHPVLIEAVKVYTDENDFIVCCEYLNV